MKIFGKKQSPQQLRLPTFKAAKSTQKIRDTYQSLLKRIRTTFHQLGPREKYFVALFALIVAGSLVAIGVQLYISSTSAVPAYGGEYREAVVGLPRFINPALAPTNDVDRDLVQLIYAGLMRYNREGDVVPNLAETYEILDEGREYHFTLKDNLVWSDGEALTAEDIVFTIELIQNPQYASPLYQSWQGVEVIAEEDNSIIFLLSSPYPPFLENTTIGILPKHIWQNVAPKNFALTDYNLQPIGAGPYRVEKFSKDSAGFISSYTLKRNERYHGQKPYIDKIIFKFYENEEEALKAYNAKNVDGVSFLSPINIDLIKDSEGLRIHELAMPRYFALFINPSQNEVLQDKTVRQALAYATNRDKIIEEVLAGFAQKADTPIPPNLKKYYNKDAGQVHLDAAKAQGVLEDRGWVDENEDGVREKEGVNLELTLVTAQRPELERVAQLIAEQWREAGILLHVRTLELGELQQDVIRPRNYELLMFGEIYGAIPDPFSFWHSSQRNNPGLNLSNYKNDTVDKLLEDARQEIDEEKRIEILKKFQTEVVKDMPAIFLYDPVYLYPVQKRVQGIEEAFIVDTSLRFVDIENWYIETKRKF